MSTRSEPPLEAKVLPDLPEPRRAAHGSVWSWLLASGAFCGFVALFALLLWGIGSFIHSGRQLTPGRRGSLIQHWESAAERLAACRASLELGGERPTAVESRELDRFFARVAESRDWPASTRLETLIDLDALTDRALRHPSLAAIDRRGRQRLRRQLEFDDRQWPGWTDIRVVAVQHGARDELLVYTIASRYEADPEPVRWWLHRRGRSWRIADWEQIVMGYSAAHRRALEEALIAGDEQSDFRRTLTAIRGAVSNREANNLPLAAQQLLDVASEQHPLPASDLINIELALAWQTCGRPDQVLAACDRIRDAAAQPAVHFLRTLVQAEREQFPETIAAALAYRELAGIHPQLLELQAAAYEAQGQHAQAASCWDDRLALVPGDRRALVERTRLAGASAPAALAAALSRVRNPEAAALAAGLEAIGDDDEAMYAAAAQFLEHCAGAACQLAQLRGERYSHDGQPQAAADQFRRAWQAAAGEPAEQSLFERFLDAMAQSGRAAQAYTEAPEPELAFSYLTAGFDEDEAPIMKDDLPLLLAAHRQRAPSDVEIEYLQGVLDLEAGRAAGAERRFAAGEAAAEDDVVRERLRSKRLEALYQQQRLAEAFQLYDGDATLIFRELAWLCHRDHNWAALDRLVMLYGRRNADDPWIDYFRALRDESQGNPAEALAAARRAAESPDPALEPQLSWLINNLSIRAEGITQSYLNSSDQREAFRRLVNNLAAREDWDGILELTELHSASGSRRTSSLYWAAKAQWNCGEYEKIAASLSPWPYDRLARLDGEQIAELYNIAVRSLLRVGRIDEAAETARHARDEYGLELPQIAVALAQKDEAGIRGLLEQRRIARALFHQALYRDRDLASLLTDPKVAEFRRQHALAWPQEFGQRNVSLVLFYDHPPTADDVRECQQAIVEVGPAASIIAGDDRQTWLWHVAADSLLLTRGEGPYCSCDDLPEWLPAGDPRRTVFEQHRGWIAIDLLLADQAIRNSVVRPAAARLAAALAARGAQACYAIGPRGYSGRPLMLDEETLGKIRDGRIFRSELGLASNSRMLLWPPPVVERSAREAAALHRDLTRLAHESRVAKSAGQARIRVRLTRGHASEDLWLTVIRSRPSLPGEEGRGEHFIAEITADSRLWPHLARGERLLVPRHLPLEVAPLETAPLAAESGRVASPVGK